MYLIQAGALLMYSNEVIYMPKGQLNSEWIYEGIDFPK